MSNRHSRVGRDLEFMIVYEDFTGKCRHRGVFGEDGLMVKFSNDLVIRYLDKVIVQDWGYEVVFKAGIEVKVER